MTMTIEEFLRIFPLRAANLMWFLGAGASAAGGIPTAGNLVWDFKRRLYAAAERVPTRLLELSIPTVRNRIQQYFATNPDFPPENSSSEYALLFERAFPDDADRRRIIDQAIRQGTPSFGHHVLAALMEMDKARVIWTTNFDRLVEDAASSAYGTTSALTTAAIENGATALDALNEDRWPLLVKLHGDFQSRRLKNIPQELQAQDATLQESLERACHRFGLIVVGYSGRDESVMTALSEAVSTRGSFPAGLFWFHRADTEPLREVVELLSRAEDNGIQSSLIESQTFDEFLADVYKQLPEVPDKIQRRIEPRLSRCISLPPRQPSKQGPFLRTNALTVIAWPSICRLVECEIGGTSEVRRAIVDGKSDVIALRQKEGVVAFGSDTEVRRIFEPFQISRFDVRSIEPQRLEFESAEFGLLYEAFIRALERGRPLVSFRRSGRRSLHVDPESAGDVLFQPLRQTVAGFRNSLGITGKLANGTINWAEAVSVRFDYRLGKLWTILEPTIWFSTPPDEETRYDAADFAKERMATRYNRQMNDLLVAWIKVLFGNASTSSLKSLQIENGINASFTVCTTTAFSGRTR